MSETEDYKDKYLRALAAGENMRKQNRKDVEQARELGRKEAVLAMLPIVDDLERAEAAPIDVAGISAIRSKARSTLAIIDVQAVESSVGKPFAAESMEAIAKVPTKALPAGQVAAEISRGYRIKGELLRPAQVVVAEDEQ
jgi:molecular chaperone GrpE